MMTQNQKEIADCIMDYYFKTRSNPSVLDGAFMRNERIKELMNSNFKEFRQDVEYVRDILLGECLIENYIGSNTNEDYCKITAKGIAIIQDYKKYSFYKWKEKQTNDKIELKESKEYTRKEIGFYITTTLLILSFALNVYQAITCGKD